MTFGAWAWSVCYEIFLALATWKNVPRSHKVVLFFMHGWYRFYARILYLTGDHLMSNVFTNTIRDRSL